jgi:hypothetical protein
MVQEGRAAGLTGSIDIPGQGAKFQVWVRKWQTKWDARMLDAAGRGDSEWTEKRPLSSSGLLSCGGKVRRDAYPVPSKFRGELASLTITLDTPAQIVLPVRVTGVSFIKADKEEVLWDVTFNCELVSDPTVSGFGGTQPNAAVETFVDKIQWANLLTRVDPKQLQGWCTRRMLVWGVSDNDSAEKTKIDAVLAALSPIYTGMKIRSGAFTRLSKNAAYVDIEWGFTDTAEDVVNPRTSTTLDPNNLATEASSAAINATPATPSGAPFVLNTTTSQELNDLNQLKTARWELLDTIDKRQMPGTYTHIDPYGIDSHGEVTTVYVTAGGIPGDPSAPSGLQIVDSVSNQLNRVMSEKHWIFDVNNSQQKITFADSKTLTDPNDLDSSTREAVIFTTGSPPSDPSVPSGQKLDERYDRPITPVLSERVYLYAKTDSKDREEFPHNWQAVDPNGLDSFASSAALDGIPATTAGYKILFQRSKKLTDTHTVNIKELGLIDSLDKAIFPHTWTATDPSGLESEAEVAAMNATASLPGGYKARYTRTRKFTDANTLNITRGGLRSSQDDWEMDRTRARGSSFAGNEQHTASVLTVTSADSAAAIAAVQLAAYKGVLQFEDLEVVKINDTRAGLILHTKDDQIVVNYEERASHRVLVPAYYTGSDILVFMRQKLKYDSDRWYYEIGFGSAYQSLIRLSIERQFVGGTLPDHPEKQDTSNNSNFLGLAAGFVTYYGADGRSNISISAPRKSPITFQLEYDSLGVFDLNDVSIGWRLTDIDLTSVDGGGPGGAGWVPASALGLSPFILSPANYGVFTATPLV